MNRISRRRFVAGLGAGLLAAPFLGRINHLRADGGTARNLVIFFSPNGTHHHLWRPQGTGSSFSFPAGSILEPLAAHKSDLIVCDGIDFKGVDNHEPGMINMLTGGGTAGSASRGQSLDWYVAQELGVRPVNLGIYTSPWGTGAQTRMSYSAAGQFAPVIDERRVTDSGGHRTLRVFLRTRLELAGVCREIDINLADRCGMRFPMLLGRTALAGMFVVNPLASFMHRRKVRETIPAPGDCR